MGTNKEKMSEEVKTARSYRGAVVDDNAIVSINIRWLGQILILVGTLVYGYYRIETRLGTLETELADANERIGDLLNKHILEERAEREELSKKITFYEKEFNINPLSWGKKRKRK